MTTEPKGCISVRGAARRADSEGARLRATELRDGAPPEDRNHPTARESLGTAAVAPWVDVAARLRPFIARRVSPADLDDVMQDVFVRMQRGLPALRDEERFASWLFQIARSSVAEHARSRARHPLADAEHEQPAEANDDDDREVARSLSACVSMFVAQLPSPYREAVTLVELEGRTTREAAEMAGISVSGMKSRVQRGRAQLRELFEKCCEIALDARGKVTDFAPHTTPCHSCK